MNTRLHVLELRVLYEVIMVCNTQCVLYFKYSVCIAIYLFNINILLNIYMIKKYQVFDYLKIVNFDI